MHHWRIHAKVEFPRLPPDVRTGGSTIFHHIQAKSELKIFMRVPGQMGGVNHLSTFDADVRNVSFALISFMAFPAILSTLQPFQMCIYNRKYTKLINIFK